MGFINAFELNSGIQQQLVHSDSQSWNDRGFASNKRVQLSSKTQVWAGWVIRSGFKFRNVLQCKLFLSGVQRELVCLQLKAWNLLKYHHTAQMRDKRQSQKGQASMKLCGNDGFNNIVIIWRHQLAGYKCFVLVKTFSVQLRKLQFSSFQSTRASYNTLQQEMRDRNSYRVSKWANETII